MLKRFFIIIIIFMLTCSAPMKIFAGFDFADVEAPTSTGTIPVEIPSTPGDDTGGGGGGSTTTTTPSTGKASFSKSFPTSINGFVFEDLISKNLIESVEADENGMAGTVQETNNRKYDSGEPKVSGVQVLNNGDQIATTNEDGEFTISGSGNYNLSFKYGATIDESDPYNYKLNKDTLKYNGQDYLMDILGRGSSETEISYLKKIKELKKSYTEIMILIDYSVSMRADPDGDGKTKGDVVKESAINFVNAIFDDAEGNIGVGFIAFSYSACIVKAPTDVKEDVIDGINNFMVVDSSVDEQYAYYKGVTVPIWSNLNQAKETGTNIGGAVEKALSAYLGTESNKVMVLFSDGAATAHEKQNKNEALGGPYYSDDSEDVKIQKLNNVAKFTRQDLEKVVAQDVTLISILNKTTDETEIEYIRKAFLRDDGTTIGSIHEVDFLNREALAEALANDIKTEIEKNLGNELVIADHDVTEYEGDDNEERREIVNSNYERLNYNNLKLFSLIDNLKGNANDTIQTVKYLGIDMPNTSEKIKNTYKDFITDDSGEIAEFIENSYMIADTNGTISLYSIESSGGRPSAVRCGSTTVYTFNYYVDPEDGIEYCRVNGPGGGIYEADCVSVTATSVNIQCALIKRDEFKLELEKKITGVRLTLSDGRILFEEVGKAKSGNETLNLNEEMEKYVNQVREVYKKILQKRENVITNLPTDLELKKNWKIEEVEEYIPETVTLVADIDILQGATLEIEYTIEVKNTSKNDTICTGVSLVDYYDNGVIYSEDGKMISEDSTNRDYGWKNLSLEELEDMNLVNENVQSNGGILCLYANYNEKEYREAEELPENGVTAADDTYAKSKYMNPRILSGGSRFTKVVVSRVLSAEVLEAFKYQNQAEIIEYMNGSSCRRINWINLEETDPDNRYVYPIAGNHVPKKLLQTSEIEALEIDTAVANPVGLIPPTGKTTNGTTLIVCGTIIVVSIITYIGIKKIYKKRH